MANFPIQRTQRTLPGRAPAVRADLDVRTGARELAQAAAGFGTALANLGIHFDVMEGKAQADVAERDAKLSMNQMVKELWEEDDVSKWDSLFNAHTERVTELTPKNRRGERQYNSVLNRLTPVWQERFIGLKSSKLDDNMKAASIVKRNNLMNSATRATMPLVIQRIETELEVLDRISPTVSREETELARAKVARDVQLSILKREALRTPEATLASIEGDRIEGFDALTVDDILRIRNIANSSITQAKMGIKQKDDAIGSEFMNLLINKLDPTKSQLTFEMIAASEMSMDSKLQWEARLRTFDNYSEGELKEAFTDNGEVLADIYNKIDTGTLTDELDTKVGDGLSPITAERIKKEIRAPYEKDTEQLFKRIFGWTPELGFGEKKLAPFLYEKTLREWKEEVKRQDATGEKIIEIGREIARPYFIEHIEKELEGQEVDISRMVDLALGEKVVELEEPAEITREALKEGEGPATYADFRAEVQRLNRIDTGKARDFYNAWIEKFTEGGEAETE